ncbi:hypothetical protein [Actinoplanes sp. G11-F43]|uniref:hypothetical protein n=1 Tax=Actinoplanes sp. G11-F43 TaxID=3424130 RepID=UPI003D342A9C
MSENDRHASPFRGFWALAGGGLGLTILLVVLDPVTAWEQCANYNGNGNASIYRDEMWDLLMPLLVALWLTAVVVEQIVSVVRHGCAETVLRAVPAITLAVCGACYIARLQILCH